MLFSVKKAFPLIFSIFLFFSCASSKVNHAESSSININENIEEKFLSSQKYVFIRLYDVTYDKIFRPGNLIRRPIRILGKAPNGTAYVHSSFSTTLKDDDFIGLSLSKRKNMATYESVTHLERNEFMSTMNPAKSRCLVLALPCTNLDYENIKKVFDYIQNHNQTYGIRCNFAVPVRHWKNGDNYESSRNFPIEFVFDSIPMQKDVEEILDRKLFVCSTFIAWILQHTVERYRVDFMVNGINPLGFTPVDLSYLEGAVPLFECGFLEYEDTLESLVEKYPRFRNFME